MTLSQNTSHMKFLQKLVKRNLIFLSSIDIKIYEYKNTNKIYILLFKNF